MLSFLFATLMSSEILPPFLRLETIPLKGYSDPYRVDGNTLYIVEDAAILKIDLISRKKSTLLKTESNSWIRNFEITDNSIYSIVYSRKSYKTTLQVHAKSTGKLIRSLPIDSEAKDVHLSPSQIFVSIKPSSISGLDIKTFKPRWTAPLKGVSVFDSIPESPEAITRSGQTLILNQGTSGIALNATNGKLLWQTEKCYLSENEFSTFKNLVFVPQDEGTVARELTTGKKVWEDKSNGHGSGIFNGKLYAMGRTHLTFFNPETGQILSRFETHSKEHVTGLEYATVIQNKLFYQGRPFSGIIGSNGTQIWNTTSANQIAEPIWTDGKVVAGYNGKSISFYAANQSLEIPRSSSERQALAQKLCEGFASLSNFEKQILTQLRDDAFLPLYNLLKNPPDTFGLFSNDVYKLLAQVTSHRQTEFLIEELKSIGQDSKGFLSITRLLAERGEPEKTASFFLDTIENPAATPTLNPENTEWFSSLIPTIQDARTIAKSIKFLDDRDMPIEIRLSAYINLPERGGELGRAAVMRNRGQRNLIDPIEVRLQLSILEEESEENPSTLHQIATASNGRTYALFASPMLGGYSDLWIAEKIQGKWQNPIFVGLSEPIRTRTASQTEAEPPKLLGKTAKELINGTWITLLPENPELYADQDGDGLTNRLEKRLGSNPDLADSDSDGDTDDQDPWPTIANRTPKTEFDEIFLIAWDAFAFSEYNWLPAAFKFPDSVTPFELPAWPGPMFPAGQLKFSEKEGRFFQDVILGLVSDDQNQNPYGIELSPDGQTATLDLGFKRGSFTTGNRYTLKKLDGQWFVTNVEISWIS